MKSHCTIYLSNISTYYSIFYHTVITYLQALGCKAVNYMKVGIMSVLNSWFN